MFTIAPAARILGHRPEMVLGILVLVSHAAARGLTVTLAHGLDGTHSEASFHYNGLGADFVMAGFRDTADKLQWRDKLRIALGQDFDLLLEDEGKPNEHWHCEFQPKAPY